MTLTKMGFEHFEDVVEMYYDFTKDVYPDRKIGEKYFFYKEVMAWINSSNHVIVVEKDGKSIGFSMSKVDDNSGLTETIYNGIIAYVKPDYRKTRAGYLLYKNVSNCAYEKNLTLTANGLVTNNVSGMIKKHFDCKEMFINFERNKK